MEIDLEKVKELNEEIEKILKERRLDDMVELGALVSKAYVECARIFRQVKEIISTTKREFPIPQEALKLENNIRLLENYTDDVRPKTLSPNSRLRERRGRALSESLSGPFRRYQEGMQRDRDARYDAMIEEQEKKDEQREKEGQEVLDDKKGHSRGGR